MAPGLGYSAIERDVCDGCTAYKVLNGNRARV
jgi:hypothetical protein